MTKTLLFLLTCLFLNQEAFSGYIQGTVRYPDGESIPYASVYVKNSTYGVATNQKGEYFLELPAGTYTIVYSFIGCQSVERIVQISTDSKLRIDIVLEPKASMVNEVEIVSDYKDWTREIMKNVRENRKKYKDKIDGYKCKVYLKTSIEKEPVRANDSESNKTKDFKNFGKVNITDSLALKIIESQYKREKINLIESVSELYVKNSGKRKEIILAHHDFSEVKGESSGKSISIGMEIGQEDIIPKTGIGNNPYILFQDASSADIDFYDSYIDLPELSPKPFLSPIAGSSALSYSFKYIESFYENGKKIYKIKVDPVFKSDPLFSGYIYIQDSTWALTAVDLSVDNSAMQYCKEFNIIQNYELIDYDYYIPTRKEFTYTIREGNHYILGNTKISYSDYEVNCEFSPKLFNNEVKSFDSYALDKDSLYWANERPVTLKDNEIEFIKKTDSLKSYYASDEYFRKTDSVFNRIDPWWFWLTGVGHRNRAKGTEWYIEGIPSQINPFGIGGYRHRLPGMFNYEFPNHTLIETDGFIDYGFNNKDVKGKISIGITYIPLKFVKTKVTVGDFYRMINNYASIEQTFSRSNYARNKTFGIAQRMEIVNGLWAELSFDYANQIPITNLQLSWWSQELFGKLNNPEDFNPYIKSELKLEVKYRFNQKYLIKDNKKYIIGTDFPEIHLIYRKGIPQLFNSEVNFDYIEIGAKDEMQLARFGTISWEANAGTFANRESLRILEHKYFRGSDRFFFSDPLKSFQLLGKTKNTRDEYFKANFIHHFNGTIMNKVPLFSRMHLSIACGAGTLMIQDENFIHNEIFFGIEKTFRIKKQLFRISVFAVTADDSLDKADFTFKFGLNFYNSYTNKWDY